MLKRILSARKDSETFSQGDAAIYYHTLKKEVKK